MKKRVLSALLAAVMLLTMLPATALAAEPQPVPDSSVSEQNGENYTSGEENGDGNVPSNVPNEDDVNNGNSNILGSEPSGGQGNNGPSQQPSRVPTGTGNSDFTGGSESTAPGAENKPVENWDALVAAIKGDSTSITLGANVTREEGDEAITISGEVTIDLLGWTLNGGENGSVITVAEGGKLTIEDTSYDGDGKITGGDARYGGGIYVDGGTLIMAGGAISGNEANSGGGVYLTNGATFTMTGGSIKENLVGSNGGGIYVGSDSTLTVSNSTISDNKGGNCNPWNVYQCGGGIYATGDGTVVSLDNVTVSNNRTATNNGYSGGGLAAEGGASLTVKNSLITGNSSFVSDDCLLHESGGGGVYIGSDANLIMENTTVSENTGLFGAGIAMTGAAGVRIESCTIQENKTMRDPNPASQGYYYKSSGAGMYIRQSGGTISSPGSGGSTEPTGVVITGTEENPTVISENIAEHYGGGVEVYTSEVTMEYVQFTGNQAENGGGLYLEKSGANVTLGEGVTISSNIAGGYGGGVYADAGEVTMTGGTITGNTANDEGGGVANAGTFHMKDGEIVSNSAPIAGGVENAGTFNMSGGKIISNNATGGQSSGVGGGVVNTGTFTMNGGAEMYDNDAKNAADDFYNGGAKTSGAVGIQVNDEWGKIHQLVPESLSAQALDADSCGTFTLRPANEFGFDNWYKDEPKKRYDEDKVRAVYTLPNDPDSSEQYLTLGEHVGKPIESVTITIQNMTAYTGGDSLSATSFPEIRYQFTASEPGVDVEEIDFKIPVGYNEGEVIYAEFSLAHNLGTHVQKVNDDGVYVIPFSDNEDVFQMPVVFTLGGKEAENDLEPGEYRIELSAAAKVLLQLYPITAEYEGREIKEVNIVPGTLTVRHVSAPEDVLDESDPKDIATKIVTDETAVNTNSNMAVAVIPADATFYTNGEENLGVLGDHENPDSPQISLMFDDLIPRDAILNDSGATTMDLLVAHAKESGHTLTNGQYQFKYLDLINENDGNAWVSTNEDITIFWPYPSNFTGNYSDYDFQLLHFTNLHRQYDVDTEEELTGLINSSTIEKIQVETTAEGVWFTLNGNVENGSFSPFALVWGKKGTTPPVSATHTVTFDAGDHGNLGGTTRYEVPDNDRFGDGRTVPDVDADRNYDFIGWRGNDGRMYSDNDIMQMYITQNWSFTAQYRRESSGGGGGSSSSGGGGSHDKPDDLNTEDHFSYIIGYPDGTIQPQGDITRAEVATIFFRMLTDEAREENWSQTNAYNDVAATDWYNNAISTLSGMGIIEGYPDGSFRPDAPITRAEFTKIAVGFFDEVGNYVAGTYSDVPADAWYADFIDAAVDLGLIEGYPDGTIRPNATITRAESCTIVNRTLGRVPHEDHLLPTDEMNVWPDNREDAWYYEQMQEATNSHDYKWITVSGDEVEKWTEKLEDRDWAALERAWSDANSAQGGQVMD